MSLPVLPSSAVIDPQRLLRLFAQADSELSLSLGDEHTIDVGRVVVNPNLSRVADANSIFNAVLLGSARATVDQVESFFSSQQSTCLKWSLRESSRELIDELQARGYHQRVSPVWRLDQMPVLELDPAAQIIPARASYRHAEQLARELGDAIDPQIAPVAIMRLEDPRVECLMLLEQNRALARVMVLSMGEVGVITSLNVLPDQRGRGLGRMMLSRALELCARATFKYVMTEIESCDARGQALYQSLGFVPLGDYITYTRTPAGCAISA